MMTIERSGFVHGMSCIAIYNSPDYTGERSFPAAEAKKGIVREREDDVDSCSSSSIGRNSESSGGTSDGDGDSGEGEVQSLFKGPLDSLDALEEVLPIKRGISTFYCGKSKSFTSLADAASCSSIKEIAKPENAYTRKRKNLLAHSSLWDKNCTPPLRSNSGGISKRLANSSRSTLALAGTMSNSESNNDSESFKSNSSSPSLRLPPLPPHGRRSPNNESSLSPPRRNFSPWRSFSLSDLQHAAAVAAPTPSITGLVINNTQEENNLH